MKKLTSYLKTTRLRQVLTVLLIGAVLLISTACSGTQAYDQTMKGLPGQTEPEVSKSARLKPEPKSGMNAYSDTDPRMVTKGAEKKAEALVKNAETNVTEKSIDSPEEFVKNYQEGAPFGERVRRIGEDVGSSAKQAKEDAQGALKREQQRAQTAGDRTQAKASEATEDTRQASENILNKATKSVKRAAEDTSGFIQGKTDEASKGTQRALEDASDTVSGNRA